jgi:flagellar basal-body rod modification protein FlgD
MYLLVTELQNQDPTAPVDPTQMVTQMVSLNSLDQLISINSILQSMSGTGSATPAASSEAAASAATRLATAPGSAAAASGGGPAGFTALNPLAAGARSGESNTFMNLYGGASAPASNSTSKTLGAN